ncbi:FAD-binding oxidoreductase [Algirhabdus cladophorae]|uniref:FAD-binding oxidoreductase n=1 Tax=Algirhabdus cladophorae TaxID=3377108 RepID=UPI003B846199
MLNPVTNAIEDQLRGLLPEACFRPLTAGYLEEPRGRYNSTEGLLLAPETTQQVSDIVALAHRESVPIIPYGGGTGLVGGQIAPSGPKPIILTLERMNRIRAVYPTENVMIAEAGVILADIQACADENDRLFALSLASEGSARIGGNLATNAGGVNVLRYGNAREQCLGLEVVLPTGEIWNGLSRLRKDNTGYDLRNLMVGAEGSLGIITAAALKLHPKPVAQGTAFFTIKDPQAALELLALANAQMGGGVSAFELVHRQGLQFLSETLPEVRQPFEQQPEWMVLLDVGLPHGLDPATALEALFEAAVEAGLSDDGVIAQSQQQRADFWALRENIPEANRRIGSVSSHDISVPISRIPEFIQRGHQKLAEIGSFRINCFGHVGDGNLHYNVFPQPGKTRADHEDQRSQIKTAVHDLVHEMEGSVSAEHGIGRLKVDDLERYSDPTKLAMLKTIKTALDPKGIMNPGVIVRSL